MEDFRFNISDLKDDSERQSWNDFVGNRHPVLSIENIDHRRSYGAHVHPVLFYKENKLAGVALFEEVEFRFQESSLEVSKFVRNVISAIKFLAGMRKIQLLLCGDKILDGALGFKFNEEFSEVEKAKVLLSSAEALTDKKEVKRQFVILKTGEKRYFQRPWIHVPTEESFSLDIVWETFDDYKTALKKKYRKRANGLLNKTNHLVVLEPTKEWWTENKDKLTELYLIASKKYRFHFDHFNLDTITAHLRNQNPCWRPFVYMDGDEIAGYFIAARKEEEFYIHLAIQRYKENSTYSIYHRMLLDMVKLGIENKKAKVKFGRTAPIAKSSLGAKPIETSIFLHSKKSWKRVFLFWLFSRTDFEPTELRNPFN